MARKPNELTGVIGSGGGGPLAFVACACSAPLSLPRPLTTPSIAVAAQETGMGRAVIAVEALSITAGAAVFRAGARIVLHLTQERRNESIYRETLASTEPHLRGSRSVRGAGLHSLAVAEARPRSCAIHAVAMLALSASIGSSVRSAGVLPGSKSLRSSALRRARENMRDRTPTRTHASSAASSFDARRLMYEITGRIALTDAGRLHGIRLRCAGAPSAERSFGPNTKRPESAVRVSADGS